METIKGDMIPQDVLDFAKELGELCAKHDLYGFQGRFNPGFQSKWNNTIQFSWDSGRHGATESKIKLSSDITALVDCPIDYKDKVSYKNAHKEQSND